MSDDSVEKLIEAVCELLHSASWFPEDEVDTPLMTVDSKAVIAMDFACNALIQERAEATHGVVRD